jgi:hypothetical protein
MTKPCRIAPSTVSRAGGLTSSSKAIKPCLVSSASNGAPHTKRCKSSWVALGMMLDMVPANRRQGPWAGEVVFDQHRRGAVLLSRNLTDRVPWRSIIR